jgi:hypothetical protein
MIPKNPKPALSTKELIEKIIQLKPLFDRLPDYDSKLEFWYDNGFAIDQRTYGITDERGKKDLAENNITIYPENEQEIRAYKKFYHKVFHEDNFKTLERSMAEYWLHIEKNNADPIPYTKKEIANIDAYYEKNSKHQQTGFNSLRSYANGFEASQNGKIKDFLDNNSFRENLLSYFTGEVDEKLRRFLVKQLQMLDGGLNNSPSHTIKDFENFIYGCNGILVNAQSDIIKWQPHFVKELWESNSFLASGKMKTAQKVWDMNGEKIFSNAHLSKTNIKHIIYVEQNTVLIQHLKTEIDKICKKLIKFKDDNNMFDVNIAPKNHWFSGLWDIVMKYKEWFDELIKPIEKPMPPQQSEILNNTGEKIQLPDNDEYNTMYNLLGLYRNSHLQHTQVANEMINPPNISTALTYHIPQVLQKHNLTPKIAAELLDRLKTVHKPSIIQNIVLPIIAYLRNNESVLKVNKPQRKKIINEKKSQQKSRQSTTTRYNEYVKTYNYFTRTKKYKHNKAEKETCKKYSISPKTLDRAIKQI